MQCFFFFFLSPVLLRNNWLSCVSLRRAAWWFDSHTLWAGYSGLSEHLSPQIDIMLKIKKKGKTFFLWWELFVFPPDRFPAYQSSCAFHSQDVFVLQLGASAPWLPSSASRLSASGDHKPRLSRRQLGFLFLSYSLRVRAVMQRLSFSDLFTCVPSRSVCAVPDDRVSSFFMTNIYMCNTCVCRYMSVSQLRYLLIDTWVVSMSRLL